jgi:Tol biopolymer transport system component
LTTETQKIEAAASISPDGEWLYYDAERSGNADLWRLPLAGGPPERLTTDPGGDFYPAVSPDGREVAFHSVRSGDRDIYVMPVAGGSPVQVSTSPLDDAVPAWSPDGQALIWRVQDTVRIARRNGDGSWGTVEALKAVSSAGVVQWSPDGRWISLASARGFELLDPVGRELHPLPAARGFFWHTWSADSRTIYGALTDPGGRMVILAVPIAGGKPRLLAYADHPLTQMYERGMVVSGSRFYFPLAERKVDVWVGVVGER